MTEQQDAMPQRGAARRPSTSASSSRTTTRCGATPWPATSPTPGSRSLATADDGPFGRRAAPGPRRPTCSSSTSTCRGCTGAEVCAALAAAQVPTRILILSASGEQPGRPRRGQGGRPRLPREVGRPRGVPRSRAGDRRRRAGLHRGSGRPRARRVPACQGRRQWRLRRDRSPSSPTARPRSSSYVATGMGYKEIAADALPLAPHRAEPRAEHPRQAADAQPRRARALRDGARPRPRRPDLTRDRRTAYVVGA